MNGNGPSDIDRLSSLQRAVIALKEMRVKLDAAESVKNEPIAIVGMGCRLPGGANDPERFWSLLCSRTDTVTEIPRERWDMDDFYDPDPSAAGKIYTRHAALLDEVDRFDAGFFGVSPREARGLDPQQRLLLEVSWEALENAGYAPKHLSEGRTGVFIGIGQNDYAQRQLNAGDPAAIDTYDGTGNGFCFASGRLSYVLGLSGPNLAVDTACSSSLVCVHLACQSLRLGESDFALAGGVQLILSPEVTVFLCRARALSPDGRSKVFDASADGYGRGEGCGVVALKRLSDAIADGDRILALIRGSAVNHGGASGGLTVPSASAQQAVIRSALENAKVEPAQVQWIETHGTGTELGDPIEVRALEAVYGEERARENPLWLSAVKANIGHLESAAGVAGLIKVVLALKHWEIPPQIHFERPNPNISWENAPVAVSREKIDWKPGNDPRRAGLSSFGISGTNAHAVLEEAPIPERVPIEVERPLHLLALSAKSETALGDMAERYVEALPTESSTRIEDVCFTANTGRSHHESRSVWIAETMPELREQLCAYCTGERSESGHSRVGAVDSQPKIAFLFTGQGSQSAGMGFELYETQPSFRSTIDRCAALLRPFLERPLLEALYPGDRKGTLLDQTAYTQTALFALEYALAELWRSWGIVPSALLGHSLGEYVAACIAGVFSLEEALKLVAQRARLMQALPQDGAMAALQIDEAAAVEIIQSHARELSVAAVNGPRSVVVSGKKSALDACLDRLSHQNIRTTKLNTSHAFHSALMEPMLDEFERAASEVHYQPPQIGIASNLTGDIASREFLDTSYWVRHIRNTVRFADGMRALHNQGCNVFLEIGPRPILLGMGAQCVEDPAVRWLASLRPGQTDWRQLLRSLGELYESGVDIDWRGFDSDYRRHRVSLPTYPFERERYWIESASTPHAKRDRGGQDSKDESLVDLIRHGETDEALRRINADSRFSGAQKELLPQIVESLAQDHRRQTVSEDIRDSLYEINWESKPRLERDRSTESELQPPGKWLILADDEGTGQALGGLLKKHGQAVKLVQANKIESSEITSLAQDSSVPFRGVIHLRSLNIPAPEQMEVPDLQKSQLCGCQSALDIAKQLADLPTGSKPQLWFVTRNAVPVGSEAASCNPMQAAILGFIQTLALEYPGLVGGAIDLGAEPLEQDAVSILWEILHTDDESEIAIRNEGRFVPRLVRANLRETRQTRIVPDATYLVTGGLGSIGLQVAQWLVQAGARNIALIGRRAAAANSRKRLQELESRGVTVRITQCDVAEPAGLQRVIEDIQRDMPPLRGVFHAAGVPGYCPVQELDWKRFESTLRAKVDGTWNLHRQTANLPLDLFVCFSSIASVWGSKGQSHYAAANRFLDAFAQYRSASGHHAISINWGPWAGGGMASDEAQAALARMGVGSLTPFHALAALEWLIGVDAPQAIVADVDWARFKPLYEVRKPQPLLERLQTGHIATSATQERESSSLIKDMESGPPEERYKRLVALLQRESGAILGFEPSRPPDPRQGFFDMGMDSLMAVDFKNRLSTAFGKPLSLTLVFDCPNIQDLADCLARDVLHWEPMSLGEEADELEPTERAVEMSDDDVESSITVSLDRLESLLD